MDLSVIKLPLGAFQANCYVVSCPETRQALVIDAPGTAEQILPHVQDLKVCCIVLTHAHPDHIQALAELRRVLEVQVAGHPDDTASLDPPAERFLQDGEEIIVGSHRLVTIHTPGHTAGSICMLHGRLLFSGDTLFPGGPGRTDIPRDFGTIVNSITRKLFCLPDDTQVCPGHGPDTVLGREKQQYAAFNARPHPALLCGDVAWMTS
jgi:hydroxyacylglutathione hydrolase